MPVVGGELSVAEIEEVSTLDTGRPPAAETEAPSVSETEPPASKTEEPAIEATEAPAAETRELPTDSSAELREVLEYNGIPVYVYRMEKGSSEEGYAFRAEFEFEGIPYEMYDFNRKNSREQVTANIENLIGRMCRAREENPENVLADVFGNKEYRVRISLYNYAIWRWHYYVETENGMECVAEKHGPDSYVFETYSVDIDNDGRKELICNNEDTRSSFHVFRENGGVIERGWWDIEEYYVEELGLNGRIVSPHED